MRSSKQLASILLLTFIFQALAQPLLAYADDFIPSQQPPPSPPTFPPPPPAPGAPAIPSTPGNSIYQPITPAAPPQNPAAGGYMTPSYPAAPLSRSGGHRYDFSILNAEERALYNSGEVSTGQEIAGGILGWTIGFGTGNLVVGGYGDVGWVFTVTEAIGVGLAVFGWYVGQQPVTCDANGNNNCVGPNLTTAAMFLYGGAALGGIFHLWEMIDVIVRPQIHNVRVSVLKQRVRDASRHADNTEYTVVPVFASNEVTHSISGYGLGLGIRF